MRTPYSKMYSISLNGEYLGEGTISELELWLNVSRFDIRKAVKSGENVGKYEVKYLGKFLKYNIMKSYKQADEEPEHKEEEDDLLKDNLAMLAYHIKTYGNTSVVFDPVPYLPDLYDMGYNCRVREVEEIEPIKKNKKGRPAKPKVHYYVEVANETKGQRAGVQE